jgi:Lyzozyme M1 (1,4-beta-N-acetylmuramidase)
MVIMKRNQKKSGSMYYAFLFLLLALSMIQAPMTAKAAIKAPSVPLSVKAVSSSYNSINISWSKVSGANGYRVYRATSSRGTYTYLAQTTSTSYKNGSLTTGKTYYYKIRAYKKSGTSKIYGGYSSIKYAKAVPAVPASVKAAASAYDSIAISWNGVAGASGYRIYAATSKSGAYSLIKTTTSKSYINTKLATGTAYYYKVRAFRTVGSTKVFGTYTAVVSAKPVLSMPAEVNPVSTLEGVVSLNWGKTAGADGYQVYSSPSPSGAFTLLAEVAEAGSTYTSLKSGISWYYKVRAFKISGSTKVYSAYSSIAGVTIPAVKVSSVSLDRSDIILELGRSDKLTAMITPQNAANPSVMWNSSDENIAKVDEFGNITSIDAGTAIITALTVDGNMTAQCVITVQKTEFKGIDVSKWQGNIKWDLVKEAGIEFAMIRSTYGSSNIDPMFETNYKAAKENGIAVGIYHYSYATTVAKALTEVKFLLSKLQGKQFEYPICVDIEDTSQSSLNKQQLTDIVLTYLTEIKNAGYYPMIYANKAWFTLKLDDSRLSDYDHWLAQWGTSITYTGEVGIWQYSSTGTVNGIAGLVDLDTSFVDFEARIKELGLNGF